MPEETETEFDHHEGLSSQERSLRQVKSLYNQFKEYGNPFENQCPELLVLQTSECAYDEVVVMRDASRCYFIWPPIH